MFTFATQLGVDWSNFLTIARISNQWDFLRRENEMKIIVFLVKLLLCKPLKLKNYPPICRGLSDKPEKLSRLYVTFGKFHAN